EENKRCVPPKSEREIRHIANSVSKYEPKAPIGSLGETSKTFREAAASLLRVLAKPGDCRVVSGIPPLDEMTGGYLGGEMIVYTADTGVGKTLLATQTRRASCANGAHSLMVSAEMESEHIASRELVTTSGVLPFKMRRPELLEQGDWSLLRKQAATLCNVCRVMDKKTTTLHIARASDEMKAKRNLSLVIIDYDELIDIDAGEGMSETERHSTVAGFAKKLARRLAVPVILVSQLRKLAPGEKNDKAHGLSRLYGSGAKAKHASIVIAVRRQYVTTLEGDDREAMISVLKNRNGAVGTVRCEFIKELLVFVARGLAVEYGSDQSKEENHERES
ncbi:MAG: DnaB-like helicase C-terminal domain-containing protein, partial [Terriglobia bacterium]